MVISILSYFPISFKIFLVFKILDRIYFKFIIYFFILYIYIMQENLSRNHNLQIVISYTRFVNLKKHKFYFGRINCLRIKNLRHFDLIVLKIIKNRKNIPYLYKDYNIRSEIVLKYFSDSTFSCFSIDSFLLWVIYAHKIKIQVN